MKKIQHLFVALCATALFASCAKDYDTIPNDGSDPYGQNSGNGNGNYIPPQTPQISVYLVAFNAPPPAHPQSIMIDKQGDGYAETTMYPLGCNTQNSGLPNNTVVLASFNMQEDLRIKMTQQPTWNWYGDVMDGYEALVDQSNRIYAYHFWGYYVASIYNVHRVRGNWIKQVVRIETEIKDVTKTADFKKWFKATWGVDYENTTFMQRMSMRNSDPNRESIK